MVCLSFIRQPLEGFIKDSSVLESVPKVEIEDGNRMGFWHEKSVTDRASKEIFSCCLHKGSEGGRISSAKSISPCLSWNLYLKGRLGMWKWENIVLSYRC